MTSPLLTNDYGIAQAKIVSLFAPHTDIIRRQKWRKPTEFGHKVWLDEVDGGIISAYRLLDGNPPDHDQWVPALDQHLKQFGHPPEQASGDRGLYSADNEVYATTLAVKRIILPQSGHKSVERRAHEHQPWFRRGRRFHAGVEGRISLLKRKYQLDRCLDHGPKGFARWVGWGVIAANLDVIGRWPSTSLNPAPAWPQWPYVTGFRLRPISHRKLGYTPIDKKKT